MARARDAVLASQPPLDVFQASAVIGATEPIVPCTGGTIIIASDEPPTSE